MTDQEAARLFAAATQRIEPNPWAGWRSGWVDTSEYPAETPAAFRRD